MGHETGFFTSMEDFVEVARFFRTLNEKLEGEVPIGEDARRLTSMLRLHVPSSLEGVTIEAAGEHEAGEPGPNDLRMVVTFPEEPASAHASAIHKCWNVCQSGPLGIGKVCVKVCVSCSFRGRSVSCTVSATVKASV